MNPIGRFQRAWKSKVTNQRLYRSAKVNEDAVFILGAPKSGTTAIATLLSMATGKSLTSDFKRAIARPTLQAELACRLLSFEDFVDLYRYEFSSDIVKEPFLSFQLDDLVGRFPNSRFIGIVRNPFQNIRSILNRLQIPGTLADLSFEDWSELRKVPAWRMSLQSELLGYPAAHYIDAMAFRWRRACELMAKHSDQCLVVKYEDFVDGKKGFVGRLADELGFPVVNDISAQVDMQFQPKGSRDVDLNSFFGDKNYSRIDLITKEIRQQFGY
ncbi:hypothetical protein VDG1235_93 [Verrucomicrobiia bacterium DG1235]|nr:hypothetical protein VDG1235_93 [Verrucomicrobiae bacterium DG1235]